MPDKKPEVSSLFLRFTTEPVKRLLVEAEGACLHRKDPRRPGPEQNDLASVRVTEGSRNPLPIDARSTVTPAEVTVLEDSRPNTQAWTSASVPAEPSSRESGVA